MARYLTKPPYRHKRDDGTIQCRWCGKPKQDFEAGRRSWCSEACVDQYLVRKPTSIRAIVQRRDRGVCAECGLDTKRITRARNRSSRHGRYRRWVRLMGLVGRPIDAHRCTWWDVDHVKPVQAGGGACGLDNLQTLCLWCHKAKTAAQR